MIKKGFTLIELLVVVAVLALLASIVFSNLGGAREGARISNALSFQSQTHSLLGSDLVGWWNFNEGDAKDISGYGNNGTITGATFTDGVPGTSGKALQFDGTINSYVNSGNGNSLKPNKTVTLSFWINPDSYQNDARQILGFRQITGFVFWKYQSGEDPNWWGVEMSSIDGGQDGRRLHAIGLSFIPLNEWTQIVILFNGESGRIDVYRNGIFLSGKDVFIGDITYSESHPDFKFGERFFGLLDDIRIYSRVLTAQEIQQIYTETKGKYLAEINE